MGDYYWVQFVVADWLSDPHLSKCFPATRGIWMDVFCAMYIDNRSGVLKGKIDQLARICRCSTAEMAAAISDLEVTGTADVTKRDGVVTIICRTMKRDADKRKSNNERQKKHRMGSVTPESQPVSRSHNLMVTDTRASESESKAKSKSDEEATASSFTNRSRGTREEFVAYAVEQKLDAADGEWLFDKMLASGWTVDGKPTHDWQALTRAWKQAGYFPTQKTKPNDEKQQKYVHQKPNGSRTDGTYNAGRTGQYRGDALTD